MSIDLGQLDEHSESEILEFKESFDNKALETIGAFANTAGGTILVGVRDDGRVTGIVVGKTTLEDWAQKMQSKIQPRFLPSMTKKKHQNRTVVVITVEKAVSPIAVDGRHYKRVGRTNQLMSSEEYKQRLLGSSSSTWDSTIEDQSTLTDLDKAAISAFIARLKKAGRRSIPKGQDHMAALQKLGLTRKGKPTRAAILLLGKDPKHFYPSAYVKAGRFKSATTIIDDREFDGTLLEQIDAVMEWFQDRLETRFVIGKSKLSGSKKLSGRALADREEVWEYPLPALREGIANAVCHRSYSSLAAATVRLYDSRLEIWNPGKLPIELSPDDLLHEHDSYPPNKLIAEMFYNLGIIERWGTGTVRMADALEEQGLPAPKFDVSSPDTFKLIMRTGRREREQLALNERQEQAIEYLESAGSLSNAEYQNLVQASKATATRDLAELVTMGLIVRKGTRGKGTLYTLAKR